MADKKSRKDLTFDEIAQVLAGCEPGSVRQGEMLGELARRQTIAQIQAAESEAKAAEAAVKAAAATEKSTRYVLWSAIAAALSAIASLASLLLRH